MADSDVQASGHNFLEGLFGHLNLDVEVAAKSGDENALVFELTGGVDRLKRSPDLVSAITLLTSQAVSRVSGERTHCLLDVGGTFEARRSLLVTAACDVGRSVAHTGRRAVFDNLSSSERRIIHTELRDDELVSTRSEGDERGRLLIVEKK